MSDLVVTGGEVLRSEGWSICDVIIRSGRIVLAASNVCEDGVPLDGVDGVTEERGTGGAGAARGLLAVTVEDDTVPAARDHLLAAGDEIRELDATGLRVVPGFIDLQCNGGYGIDLTAEPERLWELAAALPRTGVTAWLPTIVSSPADWRRRALAALRSPPAPDGGVVATPLGVHFEGPFLAPQRRAAHPETALRRPDGPDAAEAHGWSRAAGVALVTLAPELPGSVDLIRRLVDQGVVVAAGHSAATAALATAAVDAGVRWVTHLFNAMAPLHHREPGLVGVALTDERVCVGLIADGIHLHPTTVKLAARALGDRLTLVTDAVAALGRPHGPTQLGLHDAVAGDDGVRMADGRLAGSTLSLDQAVRNLVAWADVDLAAAVAAATSVPAAVLGLDDRGVIAPGTVGDLVLLDGDGRVVATVIGGRVAYDRRRADTPRP
jgi:N-acetylglucosamine-6-phosphate deacetylase